MRCQRNAETSEARKQKLLLQTEMKKEQAAADEAAVDRMIRQNIAQYGP